jgi:hypothetical protein
VTPARLLLSAERLAWAGTACGVRAWPAPAAATAPFETPARPPRGTATRLRGSDSLTTARDGAQLSRSV